MFNLLMRFKIRLAIFSSEKSQKMTYKCLFNKLICWKTEILTFTKIQVMAFYGITLQNTEFKYIDGNANKENNNKNLTL